MKLRIQNERSHAIGLLEVLVILALLAILAALLLPALATPRRRTPENYCRINLMEINLALKIWTEDNNNHYPMAVSVIDGGGKELIEKGNVAGVFQVMSNELSTPKVLICPADPKRILATNWAGLNGSYISYFVSADAMTNGNPDMILDGDDNFDVNGSPVASGLANVSSNASISWGPGRHGFTRRAHFWSFPTRNYFGNIGFADGIVQEESQSGLPQAFQQTGLVTNRIAIP